MGHSKLINLILDNTSLYALLFICLIFVCIIIVLALIMYKYLYGNMWCCFCSNVSASTVPEGSNHPPEEMPLAVELATDDNPPMRRWLIAGLDEVRKGLETLFIYILVITDNDNSDE